MASTDGTCPGTCVLVQIAVSKRYLWGLFQHGYTPRGERSWVLWVACQAAEASRRRWRPWTARMRGLLLLLLPPSSPDSCASADTQCELRVTHAGHAPPLSSSGVQTSATLQSFHTILLLRPYSTAYSATVRNQEKKKNSFPPTPACLPLSACCPPTARPLESLPVCP